MRITDLSVVGERIPFRDDFPVSYETDAYTEHIYVRLETNTEFVGDGEGTALPWFTGETTNGMVEVVDRWIRPRVEGKELDDAAAAIEEFHQSFPNAPGATSAVELALFDLRGKRIDAPVSDLLGPTVRSEVPLIAIIPAVDLDEARERANEAVKAGYRRFKLKATGDVERDVDRVNVVLDTIPADATLRVDANTGWERAETAIRAISQFDSLSQIEYIEQPVAADRTQDLRRVWAETDVPVFADESVHGQADVERLGRDGLVAGCHLKLAKSGSLRELVEMARIAQRYDLDVTVVSAFGTSVDAAANLHLAATVPNLSSAAEIIPDLVETDPTADSLSVAPTVSVPNGPGLGPRLRDDLF